MRNLGESTIVEGLGYHACHAVKDRSVEISQNPILDFAREKKPKFEFSTCI
jgi:hypothetical protein